MSNESRLREPSGRLSNSAIQQFYAGKHVFLTGCTGFLGIVILERLLYAFPDIGKVYLMIRPKKNETPESRLEHIFKSELFDMLRRKEPNFMKKIVIVQGDLAEPGLKLSPEDEKVLVDNVNIIIHNASLVKFVSKPKTTLRTNVMGTKNMLDLATKCSRVEAFMYVSTAYSHPHTMVVEEKFYPPPADLKMADEIIRADEDTAGGLSKKALENIVGDYINIYAFSKATAEGVVETYAKTSKFSCIVFRPSIVGTMLDDTYPTWLANKNGPIGATLFVYMGMLHTGYVNERMYMDAIPVDLTVNYLLAVIWNHVANRRHVAVYNYGSSDWNPMEIGKATESTLRYIEEYPTKRMIWYPFFIATNNYNLFIILHTLLHMIPAGIVDLVYLIWKQQKPRFSKITWSVFVNFALIEKFVNNTWVIKADKAKELLTNLSPVDRAVFNFDLMTLNWERDLSRYVGSLRYLLKEKPEDLVVARAKLRKFKMMHYTACTVFAFLALLFLYYIVCRILS